ncbi:MAG TPA: SH3 domain-containing protein [Candidatus Dormibacteraeota bacterium]|nr:SH3 domain-containing protein [Candidatus Dormibacteraeota bacterium]
MVRRVLIALVFVLVVSATVVAWVWWHAQPKPTGEAYVGMGDVALWDGTGPVRRQLEALSYGEKMVVLDRYSDWVEVRAPKGGVGWVSQDDLIEPEVWKRLGSLAEQVRAMTVQARGHTAVLSNIRIEAGRTSPRIGQLRAKTPVEILARAVVARAGGGDSGGSGGAGPRKEDWLLVRARTERMGEIAGWVLGDFIDEDPPAALVPAVASTGMRPVAWFKLRTVNDPTRGPIPYYLMAGTTGPEGQDCDFTMLRVFTWSIPHQQYETAFVQNGLCGRLPIGVTLESGQAQDVLFRFQNLQPPHAAILTYRMRSTIVRLLPQPGPRTGGRGGK